MSKKLNQQKSNFNPMECLNLSLLAGTNWHSRSSFVGYICIQLQGLSENSTGILLIIDLFTCNFVMDNGLETKFGIK